MTLDALVRHGDAEWGDIARWTLNALVAAEELGVTSANIDELKGSSTDPNIRRLIGLEGIKGQGLGLSDDWAYNIVKQVGNYSEVFERNVGKGSALGIARGLNALWTDGGIQYAAPIR